MASARPLQLVSQCEQGSHAWLVHTCTRPASASKVPLKASSKVVSGKSPASSYSGLFFKLQELAGRVRQQQLNNCRSNADRRQQIWWRWAGQHNKQGKQKLASYGQYDRLAGMAEKA